MAEAGAKVLNAQAVEFAKEKGIAIYARATASAAPRPRPIVGRDCRPPTSLRGCRERSPV